MRKHRLLHLIPRLPIGGAERMLLGVLRNLDATRFDSMVCCIQDRGELAEEVEKLGIPLYVLGLMNSGRFDVKAISALRLLIREQKIDLVHSHLYHANLYGRIAAWREGIPVVASVHNTYARRKWHRHLLNYLLASHTHRVTVGSKDVERDVLMHDRVAPAKIVLLPNCIDLDRVQAKLTATEAKLRLGFKMTDIVLGTVGRMEEQKGHHLLLDGFARLLDMPELPRSSLKLLVVGDGRLKEQTERHAASIGIAQACLFPGSIGDLSDIYRAMDIFVMPSLWEGLSLAMLEAMAAGLPMVATDVGGARDVLGDNERGILVSPNDADAIAVAIRDLLLNPSRRAMIATAGNLHVRENYSIASLAHRLSLIYCDALKGKADDANDSK